MSYVLPAILVGAMQFWLFGMAWHRTTMASQRELKWFKISRPHNEQNWDCRQKPWQFLTWPFDGENLFFPKWKVVVATFKLSHQVGVRKPNHTGGSSCFKRWNSTQWYGIMIIWCTTRDGILSLSNQYFKTGGSSKIVSASPQVTVVRNPPK